MFVVRALLKRSIFILSSPPFKKEKTTTNGENKSCNFILERLIKYTELLQCNGEGELTVGLAICRVSVLK